MILEECYIVNYVVTCIFSGGKQTKDKEEKEKPVSLLALVSIAICVLTTHCVHALYYALSV